MPLVGAALERRGKNFVASAPLGAEVALSVSEGYFWISAVVLLRHLLPFHLQSTSLFIETKLAAC